MWLINMKFKPPTKESKIDRIAKINCDIYLDDLPEILLAPSFSNKVKKILFDPDNHHSNQNLERAKSWVEVRDYFESQWCKISQRIMPPLCWIVQGLMVNQ